MKTIIAGSRNITNMDLVEQACVEASLVGIEVTEVISGGAQGIDKLGERYANARKLPIVRFPAEWDKYGRSAGPLRNALMAEYADALIAVWDGKSRGTQNMIRNARDKGLKVYVKVTAE